VLKADAHLFKPSDITYASPPGDNGTPLQKDEPQATNPPNGVVIDYYLKTAATGPVTLEVLDASGTVVRTFSSESASQPVQGGRGGGRGGIPNVSPLWQPAPEPFATTAGMHRIVWTPVAAPAGGGRGRGVGRGGGTVLTGTFTARLNVNGQSYTQTFSVRPERSPLTSS
jgi:hypothetical protein